MIDIHTHILPGADDGARTIEDAIRMAQAAAAEGITDLIATPHHANGNYTNPASKVRELTAFLNDRLRAEGIPVSVHTGQEIQVHDELLDAWDRGELLTLGDSRYMLIEMPHHRIPPGMTELLHELAVMGIKPIVAHPERNGDILKDPNLLDELHEYGAYAQVTAQSLTGDYGSQVAKCAWRLCRAGKIHLISSDAHDTGRRNFRMKEAYAAITREMGEAWTSYFRDNARRVLDNRDFGPAPESLKQTHRWSKIWRFGRY
mgnify:CR=1 FL=1|jgi:protein-tyrosine phosphatase